MEIIELNGTLYECTQDLARLFEWLRLEEHRVRIRKYMHPKPLVGYVRRKARYAEHGTAARPLIVYNKRSQLGRWLDEDMLESISYSNKTRGGDIWTRKEGVLIEFDLPLASVGGND